MPTKKDREKRQSIIDACRSMNALGIKLGDIWKYPAGVPAGTPWHDCGRRIAFESDAVEVETLARQYHGCLQIGTPRLLPKAEIESVLGRIAGYGPADK